MRRRFLLAAVGVALSACGARSGLPVVDRAPTTTSSSIGGTGGTGGLGGSGGVGGVAGSGGNGGACQVLTLVSPIVEVAQDSSHLGRQPKLAPASDDGQAVTVALQQIPSESPGPFLELRHSTFAPWIDWPASGLLEPTYGTYASPDLDWPFAVSGAPGGNIGLLVGHGQVVMSFSPRVDPYASDAGPSVGVPGKLAVFAARNGDLQLVGTRGPNGELFATLVRPEGGSFAIQSTTLSCSPWGIVANAVPYEDGFLVVTSNGESNGQGFCAGAPADAGAPTRIDVFRLGWDMSPSFVVGIIPGTPVDDLAAAAHPDGAWVVWRALENNPVPFTLRYARFTPALAGVLGPGDLTQPGDSPFYFVAASLGRSLAVAYQSDPADNPPDLGLRVIDDTGAPRAHLTVPDPPGFHRPTSLIASPAGDSLVVAWEREGDVVRAELARFDCVGGL